jgi:ferredoxin-NADP reductase
MPNAKKFTCRVLDKTWVTPSVVRLRFEPDKKFIFEPGQFLSVVIPRGAGNAKAVKRCYSFSSSPEEAMKSAYEMHVKVVEGGLGSGFLSELLAGETFVAWGPYGDFGFRGLAADQSICFISTGTGIAPFKSMVTSKRFQENFPKKALCLFGARTENELICPGVFEAAGVETVYAVSQPTEQWNGYRGRVTDFLRTHPGSNRWFATDFYLCGNGEMVSEAGEVLRGSYGVPPTAMHQELFSASPKKVQEAVAAENSLTDAITRVANGGVVLDFVKKVA